MSDSFSHGFGAIIGWFLGIMFLMAGFGAAIGGQGIVWGFILILMGGFFLPPFRRYLIQEQGFTPKALFVALVVCLFVASFFAPKTTSRPSTASTVSSSDEPNSDPYLKHIKGDGRFGCKNKNDFASIELMRDERDQAAFNKSLMLGIATEICVFFKAGEPVYEEDFAFPQVQVRRPGEIGDYWTTPDALQ